jgi:hypothetical protein
VRRASRLGGRSHGGESTSQGVSLVANKDKGETKSSKKKPQKSLKEKRAEKKAKGK